MEFRYSTRVSQQLYETHGLCDGIDLRIHKDAEGELKGARRCQNDWSKLVSPVKEYHGTLGDPFSFIRVTIPETSPERLEILSYANEFAFLYDDTIMEDLPQSLSPDQRQRALKSFSPGEAPNSTSINSHNKHNQNADGVKLIQSQILTEMVSIDRERAMTTMRAWQKYIEIVSSRSRQEPFYCLDEYLPYRINDAGRLFWFGLVTFGMELTIPEKEMEICHRLSESSWEALALTNDLYSWEKELKEANEAGISHVMNAIWVLMREHSVTESRAKELCRRRIQEAVSKAVVLANETRSNTALSVDLRTYVEAILYSVSGNLVWSIYCPRYHSRASVQVPYASEVLGDDGTGHEHNLRAEQHSVAA